MGPALVGLSEGPTGVGPALVGLPEGPTGVGFAVGLGAVPGHELGRLRMPVQLELLLQQSYNPGERTTSLPPTSSMPAFRQASKALHAFRTPPTVPSEPAMKKHARWPLQASCMSPTFPSYAATI